MFIAPAYVRKATAKACIYKVVSSYNSNVGCLLMWEVRESRKRARAQNHFGALEF